MPFYNTSPISKDSICNYPLYNSRIHSHHHFEFNLNSEDNFISKHLSKDLYSMQNDHSESPQSIQFESSPVYSNGHIKPKRAQVKNACTNCKKMCKKCDDSRPCNRCVKLGVADSCVSSERKPRARGVLRGPYRKRSKNPCPSCSSTQTPQTLPPFSTILAALPTPQASTSGSSASDNTCSPCNCASYNESCSSQNLSTNGNRSGSTSSSNGLNDFTRLDTPVPTELDPNSFQLSNDQVQANGYTLPWILDPYQPLDDSTLSRARDSSGSDSLIKANEMMNQMGKMKLTSRTPIGNGFLNRNDQVNGNGNLSSPSPPPSNSVRNALHF